MLTTEFNPPDVSRCDCCDSVTTTLTRFVFKDDAAHAVYYARFSESHSEGVVSVAVSLGRWGDDATPAGRRSFALELWVNDGQLGVTVKDAEDSPWNDAEFLGQMLNREEALNHPWIKQAFHVADHIVLEDEPVKAYLRQASQPAN